jgi:hypothetical protein
MAAYNSGIINRGGVNAQNALQKSFLRWSILQGQTSPAYNSEKTYDFSALYISVRNGCMDEFWNAGSRAFVAITGTHR